MSADFIDIAKQSEANARLIAAAPELLDILKRVMDHYSGEPAGDDGRQLRRDAYALIAKAEGK